MIHVYLTMISEVPILLVAKGISITVTVFIWLIIMLIYLQLFRMFLPPMSLQRSS